MKTNVRVALIFTLLSVAGCGSPVRVDFDTDTDFSTFRTYRWFDGDIQEVENPHSPGRYAYYAEITGANGIVMRRSATLFCTPSEWQGWSEYLKADIAYFPFDSIPPTWCIVFLLDTTFLPLLDCHVSVQSSDFNHN